MELKTFLTYAAAGAVITTLGSLLALFIKEFFLTRYFEKRKEVKTLDAIYKKYKDPITLAGIELSSRILEIHEDYPTVFLTKGILKLNPVFLTQNSTDDAHFRKHKLISSIYRLSAFLGWLELYRQEITFLSGSNSKTNKKLENCLLNIRSVFADGHLIEEPNWHEWKDSLIFREEQRAIGESMITLSINTKTIVGFAKFKQLFQDCVDNGANDWLIPAINFFIDLDVKKDFRKKRYFLLIGYFKELLETLDKNQTEKSVTKIKTYLSQSHNVN
jgi:hypothetical protein